MPLIVCPLRFESATLKRALRRSHATIIGDLAFACSGPGAPGVERWASQSAASIASGEVVILAGVAGSLSENLTAGDACVIDEVRSENAESWNATLILRDRASSPTRITSSQAMIHNPDARRALAQRTTADLVDMESVAFARIARQRGWRWGIVRGISDDLSTRVPSNMDRWISATGRTRPLAVLAALARKPSMLRDLRCLHDNSTRSLAKAASLIAQLLRT